jgi:hypothetical protein
MPDPKYQVKFYGHVSKDEDLFVRHFARLLEMEEDEVRSLLERVPVVMRDGLDKRRAEELQSNCSSFGALCLIEAMDGDENERASSEAAGNTSLLSKLKIPTLGDSVWFWLLAASAAAFVILASATFFSSVRHVYRKNQEPSKPAVESGLGTASESAVSTSAHVQYLRSEVVAEIEELNSRIAEQRFWLKEAEASVYRLQVMADPDKRDLEELRRRIYSLQTEIGANIKEVQSLKKRLAEIETRRQE